MYVTLEPCQMCAGALVQSRIDRVVIGSMNPKAGCAGSVLNLLQIAGFNHQVKIVQGVCQEECSVMLSDFLKSCGKRKSGRNMRRSRLERNERKFIDSYRDSMIYLKLEQPGGSGTLYHQSARLG